MHHRSFPLLTVLAILAALLLAPAALAGGAAGVDLGLMDWTDVQFTASDGAAFDGYGQAVAIDGDTAVVGAPRKTVGANDAQGAAYVYTRSDGLWTQQAALTAGDGVAYAFYGMSVAIHGDTLAVGAPVDRGLGAVYIYTRSGDTWTQQAKLTMPDTSGSQGGSIVGKRSDEFGGALSLQDGFIAVGAPGKDRTGAVYTYYRSGDTWVHQGTITSGDATDGQMFGASVGCDEDTLAVGAPGQWDLDGAVYVYEFINDQWQQQARLAEPDAAGAQAEGLVGDPVIADEFGHAVSLKGDVLAVGSPFMAVSALAEGVGADSAAGYSIPGAAYVYHRVDETWSQVAKLTPQNPGPDDFFGACVAVSGELTVFVGSPGRDVDDKSRQGMVYAYDWTGQIYQEPYQLVAGGGAAGDGMSSSLAVSHGAVLAGAPRATVGANEEQGAAWLFTLPGPTAKVKGYKSAWQDEAVRVRFSGRAAEGGAAVDFTQYRTGSGAWKTGTSVKVTRQGQTKVQFRAVDVFGTVGAVKAVNVRVDTRRPRVVAEAASARAGTIARLAFRVADPRPSSGTARMHLVVTNAAGTVVTRSTTLPVTTNAWHTVRIKALRLSPGTYRVLLHAVDRAGNEQKGWTASTLTVK